MTRGLSTSPDKLQGSIIPRITNPRIFNDAMNPIQGLMIPIVSGCFERRLVRAPIRNPIAAPCDIEALSSFTKS
jgi:hypothetical protein